MPLSIISLLWLSSYTHCCTHKEAVIVEQLVKVFNTSL